MKQTTRYWQRRSQMVCGRVSSCSLYRATKYMNVEDALLAREEKPRKRERLEDTRQDHPKRLERPTLGWSRTSS